MNRPRRGIALVAALALMTMIAMLVAGGVAASVLAQRSVRLAHVDARLGAAADFAVNSVLADAGRFDLAAIAVGERRVFTVPIDADAVVRASVAVTALPAGTLWLVADAALDGMDAGHRRISVIARFPWIGAVPGAALVARGDVRIGSRTTFSVDSSGGPSCTSMGSPDVFEALSGAHIVADSSVRIASVGTADSSTFFLAARQLAVLTAGAQVVHVRGDTTITGGTLTGVLLVDGDLTISGSFTFTGLVVARGRIDATAGGLNLTGSMMAFGGNNAQRPILDVEGATLRYSPCGIQRVLRAVAPPRPTPQRGWAELF